MTTLGRGRYNENGSAASNTFLSIQEYEDATFTRHYRVEFGATTTVREDSFSGHNSHDTTCRLDWLIRRPRRWGAAVHQTVRHVLLPIGYPHSLRPGYLSYQAYDALQGLCSYLRSVVCAAQVFKAAAAAVASDDVHYFRAAILWAYRDGLALLGGLVFASGAARYLDSYLKFWRLFADVINDVGLTLDMVSPWCKSWYLPVTAAAALCRTICGLAAGATKSAVSLYFCRAGNLADLQTKESTQETAVTCVGMYAGVMLAQYLQSIADSSRLLLVQWTWFVVLTVIHVWANYRAVRVLRLRTLNRPRFCIITKSLVEQLAAQTAADHSSLFFPTPAQVDEPVLAEVWEMLLGQRVIDTTASLATIVQDYDNVEQFSALWNNDHYVLGVTATQVLVCLLSGATPVDEVHAMLHALLVLQIRQVVNTRASRIELVASTRRALREYTNSAAGDPSRVCAALATAGWEFHDRTYLGFYGQQRYQWSKENLDQTARPKQE
jgi:Vitamin B6 photo-protection and homoeostasis